MEQALIIALQILAFGCIGTAILGLIYLCIVVIIETYNEIQQRK